MTDDEIKTIAHRTAWKYKHSGDPEHSDTYTFNDACLLNFARKVQAATIEKCARVCDANAAACCPDSMAESLLWSQSAAIRSLSVAVIPVTETPQPTTEGKP